MSNQEQNGGDSEAENSHDIQPTPPLTHEQLERLGKLSAAGEVASPDGLSTGQHGKLEAYVRQMRRARMVAFIARQIAMNLHQQQNRPAKK